MSPRAVDVVRAFAGSFVARRLDEVQRLLAPDCHDGNPDPHQPPGALGVLWKLALFHALHEGFETRVGEPAMAADGVEIAWTTRFPDGSTTAWRGRFAVQDDRIQAFEVARVDAG